MEASSDVLTLYDAEDGLAECRGLFHVPAEVVYLDGNSLGLLPIAVKHRIADVTAREWGEGLIRSWTEADWINLPAKVGAKIARLIGAAAHEVVATDSTSVNLYKTLVAAARLRPGRDVILTEDDNFPTDLYIADSVARQMGLTVRRVARDEVIASIDRRVAVVVLTHIHYKTATIHDMKRITRAAHAQGALTVWDLAHTAGAALCDLNDAGADFAIGCGYKYLNGGPGAPAFLFAASRHHDAATQPLTGWLGHSNPFAFAPAFEPAPGMARFLCGTPGILSLSALDTALEVFDKVSMTDLHAKSRCMTDAFITLFDARLARRGFTLCSERDGERRGSHVAFRHPEGYAIMRALIDRGIIGDFRAPDILRFGFAPLYNRYAEIEALVAGVEAVMDGKAWQQSGYQVRRSVT